MKPVICFEMLFDGAAAAEKIEKVADAGFKYVEFWGWRDKDIAAVKEVCRRRGVVVANFSGQRVGDLVNRATHEALIADYQDALKTAAELDTHILMVLAHELGEGGVVVNHYSEIPPEEKRAAIIEGLKKLLPHTPKDMQIVIEPLNTELDHTGYFLNDLKTASEIIEAVGDPRVKILCDLYHQGMMHDDPVELIENYVSSIGYVHIADYPGRNEPGTGSADWKAVLRALKASGYDGYVGFEYAPAGDSAVSLKAIYDLWQSAE
jgi:hydroxypyruvate isomerase